MSYRPCAIIAAQQLAALFAEEVTSTNLIDLAKKSYAFLNDKYGALDNAARRYVLVGDKDNAGIYNNAVWNEDNSKISGDKGLHSTNNAANCWAAIIAQGVEKVLKKYCATVGIYDPDKARPYALRRTFACNLIADGIDIKMVAELMGHKNIEVTHKYYTQYAIEKRKEVMQNFDITGNR